MRQQAQYGGHDLQRIVDTNGSNLGVVSNMFGFCQPSCGGKQKEHDVETDSETGRRASSRRVRVDN